MILGAVAVMTFGLAERARAATYPFEYDWVSSANVLGYSGKIFFDTSSDANGSLSNIDLTNSFITTPDGTFFFANGNFAFGPTQIGTLSWNGSQILAMDIQGEEQNTIVVNHWEAQANSISDQPFLFDVIPGTLQSDSGSWLAAAAVPEPSTWVLPCLAIATLAGMRLRRRRA
jgi:hypothetical protein